MQVQQTVLKTPGDWASLEGLQGMQPHLLLVFGAVRFFQAPDFASALQSRFPSAVLLGCSTAGEVTAQGVEDETCTVTAVRFAGTALVQAGTSMGGMEDSRAAGKRLGLALVAPDLKAVLVFGPGVQVNGSALVQGMSEVLGAHVPITGGLAADGGAFTRTFTLGPEGISDQGVVAVGLCGEHIRLGHGSFGGWEPFGPDRKVTRSRGNVLYELDGEPALAIYKRYLGSHADGLPASGLLFPFAMLGQDHNAMGLIRTILGIDEAEGSLTLAGEIEEGGYLKLMHASTDKLVNGAEAAAEAARDMLAGDGAALAILVSCIGRKLVMGDRVDEEVEAVGDVFGQGAVLTGFYSNGEISPFTPGGECRLHNQTMTVTTLREV